MMIIRQQKHDNRGPRWHFVVRIDSRRVRQAFFLIFVCCLFLNASPRAFSMNEETVEYPVKLAFLYNFTKFVEWPDDSYRSPRSPLTICIVGNDPFSPAIEAELRTRTVGSHPIEVKMLRRSDMSACQIVFVP